MTHGSICSGIGGAELAATWAGWETLFHCEINPFCRKILKYYWPHAKTYSDIKQTDFTIYRGKIDVLSAGFPCQPNSVAGQRKGTNDDRYLWPEVRRAYQESQPRIIVAENVTGILSVEDKTGVWKEVFPKVESRKIARYNNIDYYEAIYSRQSKMLINTICENLEEDGYEAIPIVIPAAAVGAPHRRDRVWIIGYSQHYGSYDPEIRGNDQKSPIPSGENEIRKPQGATGVQSGSTSDANSDDAGRYRHGETGREKREAESEGSQWEWFRAFTERTSEEGDAANADKLDGDISGFRTGEISQQQTTTIFSNSHANTNSKRLEGRQNKGVSAKSRKKYNQQPTGFLRPNWINFPTQSPVCGGDDGISRRLDGITVSKLRTESIKALGNAWVPQIAYEIFKMINQIEDERLHSA